MILQRRQLPALSVPLLAAAGIFLLIGTIRSVKVYATADHLKGSAEFQAINSYLSQSLGLDQSVELAPIVATLNDAIRTMESIGLGTWSQLSAERDTVNLDARYKPLLLDNEPEILLSILKQLVEATRSCGQESIGFLMLVAKQQTFAGQFLNKFARHLTEKCWLFQVQNFSHLLVRSLGKMDKSLFDFIQSLANRVELGDKKVKQRSRGEIFIADEADANEINTQEVGNKQVTSLKQLTSSLMSSDAKFGAFISALIAQQASADTRSDDNEDDNETLASETRAGSRASFYRETLAEPCAEVLSRARRFVGPFPLNRLLIDEPSMIAQRKSNPQLDYSLEVVEFCNKISISGIEMRILRLLGAN